jgi:hypothetical protein
LWNIHLPQTDNCLGIKERHKAEVSKKDKTTEKLLDTFTSHSRGIKEHKATGTDIILDFCCRDHSRTLQIRFVTYDGNCALGASNCCKCINLCLNRGKGTTVCGVKHNNCKSRIPIIDGSKGTIALLAGSVPDLNFDMKAINVGAIDLTIRADRLGLSSIEPAVN